MIKKTIIFMLAMLFISSLFAGTYIVNNPAPGEKWVKFGIHKITWLKIGDNTKKVSLYLYSKDGKEKILEIVKNIKNIGEYICPLNIFANIPSGEYKIIIKKANGKICGESKVFKIVDRITPSPDNTIKLLSPSTTIFATPGKFLDIKWKTKNKSVRNFLIELYTVNDGKKVLEIKRLIPPSIGLPSHKRIKKRYFHYQWKIPENLKKGKYIIKISIPNKNVKVYTPLIEINRVDIKKEIRRHREK